MVGLDIGTSSVRAAQLSRGRAGVTLERFGQVALPPGAVRDGEVADPDAVAGAVRELWTSARFGTRTVVVGVANRKVVVRQVDLPWLPGDELRRSLAFSVQDVLPMPVEQAILDLHPLEEYTGEGGARTVRALLVAAAREMVDATLLAVARAGLRPALLDLNGFAVLRSQAHAASRLGSVHAEALVDVGAAVTNIVVHQGGVPRFVRILLMGGADVTEAVAERLGVPLEQAEAIKQEAGMIAAASDPGHPADRAIEATGSALVEEVRGSLDYYLAQPGAVRIERVVLSGGGALLAGLPGRLAAATRLPVDAARPMQLLRPGRTGLTEDQLAQLEPVAAVPVGLALDAAA